MKFPTSFIEIPVFSDEYHFGSTGLSGAILQPSGDWRSYAMSFENQRKRIESSSCVTYSILNALEILARFHWRSIPNYAERFTSTLAGTTREGNTPQKVLETIRKYGLIEERLLPFTDDIETWEQYFSPVPDSLKKVGKKWLNSHSIGHDWVFTPKTRKEEKEQRLQDALMYSPIPVSVQAWNEKDGVYYKKGGDDNHMCLCVGYDRDYWYILDTYDPFLKKLERGYDFGYAKRVVLEKKKGLFSYFRRVD